MRGTSRPKKKRKREQIILGLKRKEKENRRRRGDNKPLNGWIANFCHQGGNMRKNKKDLQWWRTHPTSIFPKLEE